MADQNAIGLLGQAQLSRSYHTLFVERSPKGLDELLQLAEQGSPLSMIYIGLAYKKGICVEKNAITAEQWFQRAADTGSLRGHYQLGRLYLDTKRYQQAEAAFGLAAEKHFPIALYYLGRMYLYSLGVKQDVHKARLLLERSFSLGNVYAKRGLGFLLLVYGHGIRERMKGAGMYLSARKEIRHSRGEPE